MAAALELGFDAGYPLNWESVARDAAQRGDMAALRAVTLYLRERWRTHPASMSVYASMFTGAAAGGQLRVMRLLKERSSAALWDHVVAEPRVAAQLLSQAARAGSLDLLRWLRVQGCRWERATIAADAAAGGSLPALQWLRGQGCPLDEAAFAGAARAGNLDVLRWLREQGCAWSDEACAVAAARGHLAVLQWLRAQGCPWDPEAICPAAAANGHLAVVRWARQQGCAWSAGTVAVAAVGGHTAAVQWLLGAGCPRDITCCMMAMSSGNLRMVRWLRAHGHWCDLAEEHLDVCVLISAKEGNLRMLRWLRQELSARWVRPACTAAAAGGHVGLLSWARAQGCPWEEAEVYAAARKQPPVLLWAHRGGHPPGHLPPDLPYTDLHAFMRSTRTLRFKWRRLARRFMAHSTLSSRLFILSGLTYGLLMAGMTYRDAGRDASRATGPRHQLAGVAMQVLMIASQCF